MKLRKLRGGKEEGSNEEKKESFKKEIRIKNYNGLRKNTL
jgi:hypothetical protein